MKKIIRLTENDLARIIRRVINEGNDDIIKIPKKFKALRMEIGDESTPSEIKKLWNKYVLPDTMGDTPKLSSFEDGKFVNADGKSLPISAILDELNYAFSDEEDEDDYLVEQSTPQKQAPLNIKSTYEAIRSTDKQKYQITINGIYTDPDDGYNGYMASIVGPGTYEGKELTAQNAAAGEVAAKYRNSLYPNNMDPVRCELRKSMFYLHQDLHRL